MRFNFYNWTRIARLFFTDSDTLKSVAIPHRKACGRPKNDAILSYYATPHLYQTHHSELLFHFSLNCVLLPACLFLLYNIYTENVYLCRTYSHITRIQEISLMVELKQGKMCIFSKCAVTQWNMICLLWAKNASPFRCYQPHLFV